MKLGKLINDDFVNSLNDVNGQKISGTVSYKISKISAKAMEEQKEFFKIRAQVIEKYVKKNEDGSRKTVERDGKVLLDFGVDADQLEKELTDLAAEEVEVPKIKMSELLNSDAKISGAQINDLKDVIDDDMA